MLRRTENSMDFSEIREQVEALHRSSFCWALACCRRDHVEAEEVLQTVYVKILDGRARFRGDAALKTWLFSLIRNTAADSRRRHFLQRLGRLRLVERADPEPRAEEPEESVFRSETREAFRR